MCRTRCVLVLVVLCVGLAQSWDIAATKGDRLEFYTNGIKTESIRFDTKNLAALVYAEVLNIMLYVDKQNGNDAVCGYDLSTKENKCFNETTGRDIHGLAFDPVTEKLFFSDTRQSSINWISLKGGLVVNSHGSFLISDGIPTDIAVDSCRGYVYWINTNLMPPTIERARFDGSEKKVIITSVAIDSPNKLEPHSLVIDQQTQRMYWIEPETSYIDRVYIADLNGSNKQPFHSFLSAELHTQTSLNTLTVSKTKLIWVDSQYCSDCDVSVWEFPKSRMTPWSSYVTLTAHKKGHTIGMVVNYKIEEKLPRIQDCELLKRLVQNKTGGPFCIYGKKIKGQSRCTCTPGYIGDQCDVSVCENYCLQGDCSLNIAGVPKCRCNAGYSGYRCEVYACHGYCLNNGVCRLNEKGEPLCQCVGKHDGPRCEGVGNDSCVNKNQY